MPNVLTRSVTSSTLEMISAISLMFQRRKALFPGCILHFLRSTRILRHTPSCYKWARLFWISLEDVFTTKILGRLRRNQMGKSFSPRRTRRARSSDFQSSEPFVSFVTFVVKNPFLLGVLCVPSTSLRTCFAGDIPRLTGVRSAPYENSYPNFAPWRLCGRSSGFRLRRSRARSFVVNEILVTVPGFTWESLKTIK